MESTSNQKTFLLRIADQLVKDQEELDHLAVQLSLGKAEVRDQFEAAKQKLRGSVHDFKVELQKDYNQGKDWAKSFGDKLSHLDEKLNEVKAETKEKFEEQRQNIQQSIEELKNDIRNNPDVLKVSDFFTSASEKAKLQFEIIGKKWDTTATSMAESFNEEMKTAKLKINEVIEKAKEKKENAGEKMDSFNEEIHEAYEHLKKAIKSL